MPSRKGFRFQSFRPRFQLARQAAGLTRLELAARRSVACSIVSRIERGQADPRPALRERILAVLGASDQIFQTFAEFAVERHTSAAVPPSATEASRG